MCRSRRPLQPTFTVTSPLPEGIWTGPTPEERAGIDAAIAARIAAREAERAAETAELVGSTTVETMNRKELVPA
jgi:hypothetical protein